MSKITADDLAIMLNGFNIEDSFTRSIVKLAKNNDLVILSSLGNDTVILSGAITDEFDLIHGGQIFLEKENNEYIPYTRNNPDKTRKKIEAFWEEYGYYKWKFLTLIKHSSYNLNRKGNVFCKGIIFNINDI